MENYPLYGEARAALSRNCEERHKNIRLFNNAAPSPLHSQCGGISASPHREHKWKSKSFQRWFWCKMGCILIEYYEILNSRVALWKGGEMKGTAHRGKIAAVMLRHNMLHGALNMYDSQGKNSLSSKIVIFLLKTALIWQPCVFLFFFCLFKLHLNPK